MRVPVPVVDDSQGLPPEVVVAVAAAGALVGAMVLALALGAWLRTRARQVFIILVATLGVLSCLPVLGLAPDPATAVGLTLMHLLTAGIALVAMVPTLPKVQPVTT